MGVRDDQQFHAAGVEFLGVAGFRRRDSAAQRDASLLNVIHHLKYHLKS